MARSGHVEGNSDAMYELVERDARVTRLATGFGFTEGPVWHPTEHHLLFSDLAQDARWRYSLDGAVVAAKQFAYRCNGMTYDDDLNLIVCEHVTSIVVRELADGSREILARTFEGEELNSPNDVVVHSSGAIYFTDPWYGRMPQHGLERRRRLGFQGVYRISPGGGDVELLVERDDFDMPNGLCFSPDESVLYVSDTRRAQIKAFRVHPDGSLAAGRTFFDGIGSPPSGEGHVDGIKCDERGDIWATGPGGVWVISAHGEHLGTIRVPEVTANLAWGGADWHTLFTTSSTSLYSVRTLVGPRREPYMR